MKFGSAPEEKQNSSIGAALGFGANVVNATGFQRGNGQWRLQQFLLALLAFGSPGEGGLDTETCGKSASGLEHEKGYFVFVLCMLMSFVIGVIFGAAIVARM